MKHVADILGATLVVGVACLALASCNLQEPGGCTSNADCRADRLCSTSGNCLPPGAVGQDTSDGDTSNSGETGAVDVAASTLRDRCGPVDQRIVEFVFALEEGLTCGKRSTPFVRVTFESPEWENSPGELKAGSAGDDGTVEFCQAADDCSEVGGAVLNITDYFVSEKVIQGSYELTFPQQPDVTGTLASGQLKDTQVCSQGQPRCG